MNKKRSLELLKTKRDLVYSQFSNEFLDILEGLDINELMQVGITEEMLLASDIPNMARQLALKERVIRSNSAGIIELARVLDINSSELFDNLVVHSLNSEGRLLHSLLDNPAVTHIINSTLCYDIALNQESIGRISAKTHIKAVRKVSQNNVCL